MWKRIVIASIIILAVVLILRKTDFSPKITNLPENPVKKEETYYPLSIQALKDADFPGSDIKIEQTLKPGGNYKKYIASYTSEGNRIYGLLTIPDSSPPSRGFPIIIFNHGYINPEVYQTTEKYLAYQDAFAKAGYVTFKPDYRGHGNSEGDATGGYGSNAYTIDVINAMESVKKLKDPAGKVTPLVDPENIGMWGHSMGGYITLRAMVTRPDIKAGVIWGGVVASYDDLINNWHRKDPVPTEIQMRSRRWRQELMALYGTPETNPDFWNSISSTSYLDDISGPLELHHGTADASVPIEFSQKLAESLQQKGKSVEFYKYEGDDHNLSKNLTLALNRSVAFFDKNLKNNNQ